MFGLSFFNFEDFDGYPDCGDPEVREDGFLLDDQTAEWYSSDDYPPSDEGDEDWC